MARDRSSAELVIAWMIRAIGSLVGEACGAALARSTLRPFDFTHFKFRGE